MAHTVIIGGGIAGLYLAEQLAMRERDRDRDHKVLLLEKNNYFGGRVYTFIDKSKDLQYEAGAGRIHRDHARVNALVAWFGLKKYYFSGNAETISINNGKRSHTNYVPIFDALQKILTRLDPADLRHHTIAELLPPQHRSILRLFPYWAETHMMRADLALDSFRPDGVMADRRADAFYGIYGGIETLTDSLIKTARAAGATLKSGHEVLDVVRLPSGQFLLTVKGLSDMTVDRVIFATCRCTLGTFRLIRDESFIGNLATSPLLRIYAVYPPDSATGRTWFAGMDTVVTDGPLRYVIPINAKKGLIMISYTDGDDTKIWHGLEGDALQTAIQTEVRRFWPTLEIPEPTYLRKHYWGGGCTYWLPGDYDVVAEAAHALNPQPGVYVCGESISSHHQAWIEGALETAEALLCRLP
jgi:glycine/D-amino acid oxidase-like deaminating enzyme